MKTTFQEDSDNTGQTRKKSEEKRQNVNTHPRHIHPNRHKHKTVKLEK